MTAAVLLVLGLIAAAADYWRTRQIREALYAAFTPVTITNCEFKRYGNLNDGGYLLCGNLLGDVRTGYSYGIDGEDAWGCDIAAQTRAPIHQYDCFNVTVPRCAGDQVTIFHAECVGPVRETIEGRPFDSIANQVERNGDAGKRLVMKVDVEGSEWQSLIAAPDHVLNLIDQMAVEFHGLEVASHLETAARLKQFFHVAHVHQNNFLCEPGFDPFPSQVFEVLLVNKRIAVADPSATWQGLSPLDAANRPRLADCQPSPGASEPRRVAGWVRRNVRGLVRWIRS